MARKKQKRKSIVRPKRKKQVTRPKRKLNHQPVWMATVKEESSDHVEQKVSRYYRVRHNGEVYVSVAWFVLAAARPSFKGVRWYRLSAGEEKMLKRQGLSSRSAWTKTEMCIPSDQLVYLK